MTFSRARPPKPARFGLGLLTAACLLLAVEACLRTDAFLHRYRSVSAAGRALDKTQHAESHRPELRIIGSSRTDNAFDPVTLRSDLAFALDRPAFNLGVPGADTRVLAGIVDRLDRAGAIGPDGVRYAVIVLDEALVQAVDTLGQEVYFARASRMWSDGQYHDALRATLRLYGYSANLRQLREPATLARFIHASFDDVDPVGGGAAAHLGYRAGFRGLQDAQSARMQEAGSLAEPDAVNLTHLWRMIDLMQGRGVRVAVVFPPLLNRDVLYRGGSARERAPYLAIVHELDRRSVPMLRLDAGPPRDRAEFVNAGHLNDRGAQRYSALLGQQLSRLWAGDSSRRADLAVQAKAP